MAGRIPQQFIDELLARTDIVDVIDAYVPLKKAGKNHQACCPFHDEKTPSFTASQQKQFYYCFGCGAKGSAISFLMEYLNIGYVDAIEELASRAGMQVPSEMATTSKTNLDTKELYELMELINKFYLKQLRHHPESQRVIDYLKGRGISGEIAAQYELGFAPSGWSNLIKELGRSDAALKRLQKIGMVIDNERGGYYDRFRDRLMFPIRNQRGSVIGFGGRVLDKDSKPKYLNSPETLIFQKGQELYGLYHARGILKDKDCIFVVEGYMDVIALAQHGIGNAVASLGTSATSEHISRLFRHTGKIVFCFDGDAAGNKAAWRALENSLPQLKEGRQVHFMLLPEGEDPDTSVRTKGASAFISEVSQTPLSGFLFHTLQKNIDLKIPEGRALLIEKTLPYIARLPTGALRNLLTRDLASLARYDLAELEKALKQPRQKMSAGNVRIKPAQNNKGVEKIRWIVRALLHQPELARQVKNLDKMATFKSPGIQFLCELIAFIQQCPNITTAVIIEKWRDSKFAAKLQELVEEDELVNEIGVTQDSFQEAIDNLIKSNTDEFELIKSISSPSELTEEQKEHFRSFQRSDA